jgi:hypothetical protein
MLVDTQAEGWQVLYANPAAQQALRSKEAGGPGGALVGSGLQQLLGPHMQEAPELWSSLQDMAAAGGAFRLEAARLDVPEVAEGAAGDATGKVSAVMQGGDQQEAGGSTEQQEAGGSTEQQLPLEDSAWGVPPGKMLPAGTAHTMASTVVSAEPAAAASHVTSSPASSGQHGIADSCWSMHQLMGSAHSTQHSRTAPFSPVLAMGSRGSPFDLNFRPADRDVLDSATPAANIPCWLGSDLQQEAAHRPPPPRYLFISLRPSKAPELPAAAPQAAPAGVVSAAGALAGRALGAAAPGPRPLSCSYSCQDYGVPGLALQQLLGRGQYGAVYLGAWGGRGVAVKVVEPLDEGSEELAVVAREVGG